jgi:hypothetical protein
MLAMPVSHFFLGRAKCPQNLSNCLDHLERSLFEALILEYPKSITARGYQNYKVTAHGQNKYI